MKILVTNDDGFDNPAIWSLVRAVKDLGEVTVVAPAANQSGVGTALTLRTSLKINEAPSRVDGVKCYAVSGTPADSVVLGLEHIFVGGADVVVSGINPGFNTSRNVFISGTMGAAIQAAAKGVKTCAFSMDVEGDFDDSTVKAVIAAITTELLSTETERGALFNVNIPRFCDTPIEGIEGAAPAPSELKSLIKSHSDGGYEIISGLAVNIDRLELAPGTDLEVLSRNRIAISSFEGPTLAHQPEDPTLQRMIEAVKRVIG
ncbi:MAG: 5'/3'-nucleotidase SurE [Chloroflexi bacterium]|jgi:5'-nucleotidase|nr:5'/3'-nucleotidase SurE [Chloroflexota bacterium]MBT6707845.1 5'/3'-nucleotidase SurE [Chloroflexota bacterium]MBT7004714.1 5'/3'-nucleotidase SurE [Chloroflexota bacterium]MBT7467104.1 5'/3'-nucleotidase SurE [Chloroflexota bacterium]MBT7833055.1 5'/3'-nucleotidase SurE [Chloroflexota bacterium]